MIAVESNLMRKILFKFLACQTNTLLPCAGPAVEKGQLRRAEASEENISRSSIIGPPTRRALCQQGLKGISQLLAGILEGSQESIQPLWFQGELCKKLRGE